MKRQAAKLLALNIDGLYERRLGQGFTVIFATHEAKEAFKKGGWFLLVSGDTCILISPVSTFDALAAGKIPCSINTTPHKTYTHNCTTHIAGSLVWSQRATSLSAIQVFKAYEAIPKQTVGMLQAENSEACLLYIGENMEVVSSTAMERDETRIWEVLKAGNGMPLKHLSPSERETYMSTCCKVFLTPATPFTRATLCRMAGTTQAMKRNQALPRLQALPEMVSQDYQPLLWAHALDQVIVLMGNQPDCTFGEVLSFSLLGIQNQNKDILEDLVVRDEEPKPKVKAVQHIQIPVLQVKRAREAFWGKALTKLEVDILLEEVEEVVPAHLIFLDEVRNFLRKGEDLDEGEEGGPTDMDGVELSQPGGGDLPGQREGQHTPVGSQHIPACSSQGGAASSTTHPPSHHTGGTAGVSHPVHKCHQPSLLSNTTSWI